MTAKAYYGEKTTKIRMLIIERGMTQKDLAELAELSLSQVSYICSGKKINFDLDTAKRISKVLNVTLDEAFGDDEN